MASSLEHIEQLQDNLNSKVDKLLVQLKQQHLFNKNGNRAIETRNEELRQMCSDVENKRQALDLEKTIFHREAKEARDFNTVTSGLIRLNVGGEIMVIPLFHLTKIPGTKLNALFSGRHKILKGV